MEFGKFSRYLKYSIILVVALIICDIGLVKSSDFKRFFKVDEKTEIDFENVFFQYSSSYENYDSYSNQFDNFFGMSFLETGTKRNFQDLSISIDAKKLRDLYEDMLEDITNIGNSNIDKEPFYRKKI